MAANKPTGKPARPAALPSARPTRPGRKPTRSNTPTAPRPPLDLSATFLALKGLLVKHARHLLIVHDAPDEYYLNSRKPAPDGKPLFFAAVDLKRDHVVYRLMPVQVDPSLATLVSPTLRKFMQGKGTFAFTEPDPVALEELDRLTRAGMASFERKGLA